MSKHTMGPWKYDQGINSQANVTVNLAHRVQIPNGFDQDFGSTVYIDTNNFNPSIEANARLIAAAPELLEACRLAFSQLDDSDSEFTSLFQTLKQAIAKAEGK